MTRLWWRFTDWFWGAASEAMWTQAVRCRRARALRQADRFCNLAKECTYRQDMAHDRLLGGR